MKKHIVKKIENTLYKIHSKILDSDIEFYDTLDECYIERIENVNIDDRLETIKTTFKIYE